jgi:crotonobetainyl-CoA:carnitine CoA-transferase CaiB-like acyl-CoA transferase
MKLEGLRVIDLSLFLPGPQASLMMADHGASVIKV